MPCVSVITPWLDHPELAADYEAAVGSGPGVEPVIVDNGSSARDAEPLERLAGRLGGKYVRLETNCWFAGACNAGMAAAGGGVILFLHNDVAAPSAGWLDLVRREVRDGALYGPSLREGTVEGAAVRYIEGWCIAGTRRTWEALGGWDEEAFALPGWEDADLSLRAVRAGLRLVQTRWPIRHKGGLTTSTVPGAGMGEAHNRARLLARLRGHEPVGAPSDIWSRRVLRTRIPESDPGQEAMSGATVKTEPKISAAAEHLRQGQLVEAERAARAAAEREPDNAEAWHLLARLTHLSGRDEAAADMARRAAGLAPAKAEYHLTLGMLLSRLGETASAVESYEAAARLRPESADIRNDLAVALERRGRLTDAAEGYREALRLRPSFFQARVNLANLLLQQGRLEEAEAECREALGAEPGYAEAYNVLGATLMDAGRAAEARNAYRQAVRLAPGHVDAHANLGLALLTLGELEEGWREYEWRRRRGGAQWQRAGEPWNGSDPFGKTLLLYGEGGLGNVIHFARYAGVLADMGATVILECQPALRPLLRTVPGAWRVLGWGERPPRHDYYCPLLSVPGLLGTTLASAAARVPYLSADAERVRYWRERLEALRDSAARPAGLTVGVAWEAEQRTAYGRRRSVPLEALAPLARVPGVRLVSLQKGWKGWAGHAPFPLRALEGLDEREPFLDTAAVMKCVDLMVSADTSTAHLAGALGVEAWVAVTHAPDWRWMLGREDSPWYPTLRLFRQPSRGDWAGVFRRMAEALENWPGRAEVTSP